jgi:NAD(P)-dependent dehydrogenase (short-subunit alcohol dehydrogenase family)
MRRRLAIVTGGGKGIGRAVVAQLVADGLRVIAAGRDVETVARAVASIDGEAEPARCDVTSEEEVAALFDAAGDVDVLVNNAGMSVSAPLAQTTLDDWRRQLDVNATGAFLCTRAVLPGMVERDHGRIVTVASTAGRVGSRYTAAYTASKHAAVGLMRAAAAEVAGTGVTANAVCPTFTDTPMTERSVARIADATGRSEAESLRALETSSPLGRLVQPDEVAAAVSFLISVRAAVLNGQTLVLDGGGIQA